MKQNWKLICKNKPQVSGISTNRAFVGTFAQLQAEIDRINNYNFSYLIIDFELINAK